jgi:transposase
MALGKRKMERQAELWVVTPQLPVSPGHVFYEKLKGLLVEAGFESWIEGLCEPYYAKSVSANHSHS